MNLKGKVAVVTGSSSGIGKAIAIALVSEGCKIVFTYNKNELGAKDTLKQIGDGCFKFKANLTSQKDIKDLLNFVSSKFGKIDVLVNNAGADYSGDQLDVNLWRKTFETDVFAVVSVTSEFLSFLKNGSRILNISSLAGLERFGYEDIVPYSAAKSAINSFTRTLAKIVSPKILVNAIAPGYTKTPIWHMDDKKEKEYSKDLLIGRFIKPEEVADMAVAVIKNDGMTGEIVVVDGGLSLKTV